jgi:MoxR-like ATPase
MEKISSTEDNTLRQVDELKETFAALKKEIGHQIFGQEEVVEKAIITLLAGGHALLIGVPGLAKTRLARTLGIVMGLDEKRVQFTPDLMPADILGSEILEKDETGRQHFRFLRGPIFTQLLMADEINRASPRTQSALLQAMQEKHVTIAGQQYDLPAPFHVLATQNPIEQEGTYPLPEAQLDRFLMQINIDYPSMETEKQILLETTGNSATEPRAIMNTSTLAAAQKLVRDIPVSDQVIEAILTIVHSARPQNSEHSQVKEYVSWGPGPRASQALILAVRAKALLEGRFSPSVEDVVALAPPILIHRMALSYNARAEGLTLDAVIDTLLNPLR